MAVIPGRADCSSPMGATVVADGTLFRTWAPTARSVSVVAGDRLAAAQAPGWQPQPKDALLPLGDGSWGGFLSDIGDGDAYMYFIAGAGSIGWKRDPFARELTLVPAFPDCFCVVRDPARYPWHDHDWTPPAFSDLVIYQLHIGTWWAVDATGADARATTGGQFLDVVTKLPYLRSLGINAVQFLPIQEFETRFSMGYNGVDYFSPEGRLPDRAGRVGALPGDGECHAGGI